MNQIARFWILVLSFTSSAITFSYLFLSVWQPGARKITTGTEIRVLVLGAAMISIGVFTWAAVFATPAPESASPGEETDTRDGPEL